MNCRKVEETSAPGADLIYTETFANTGSAAALNNVITLPVPGYDANVSSVRWTFTGSPAPAAAGTLQFTVHMQ